MAETSKRTTNNSTSKSRKSKSEAIRSKLGSYLKQKKYSTNERFRKSDLALKQTQDQYDVEKWLDEETAKGNLFLYSNVACLSNTKSSVDLQFSKFLNFIQSQTVPSIKAELEAFLWPLMCHIYIEMIKGRDTRPAVEFLRKYAPLVGPVENLHSPTGDDTNGDAQSEAERDIITLSTTPAAPIIYTKTAADSEREGASLTMGQKNDIEVNLHEINDYFKELIQTLSLCLRIDDINAIDIAHDFRSRKYEMVMSLQSLYAMKNYLAENGHSVILHAIQYFFSLDIREFQIESEKDSDDDNDDEASIDDASGAGGGSVSGVDDPDTQEIINNGGDLNNGDDVVMEEQSDANVDVNVDANVDVNVDPNIDVNVDPNIDVNVDPNIDVNVNADANANANANATVNVNVNDLNAVDACTQFERRQTELRNLVEKVASEIRTYNNLSKYNSKVGSASTDKTTRSDPFAIPLDHTLPKPSQESKTFNVVQNKYLQNVRAAVMRTRRFDAPVRIFNVVNANRLLTSCDIDENNCHLVCGLDDSTIKLWQLNQSKMRGRKPFGPISHRFCEWSLEDCESGSSSCSSDDECDYVKQKKRAPAMGLFARPRTTIVYDKHTGIATKPTSKLKRELKSEFYRQRNVGNTFNDNGCVVLRGHNKGVTDVVLSRYNPLLYSVSKDNTLRAWKACDYRCAGVYRGHSCAIWCVAESANGLYIATGSRDLTARLWVTDRLHPLKTYIGHTQDVDAIAFHPNGNYIATGSTDLTIRMWDFTSGQQTRVFIDCHLPVHCVSFSPDGRYLAAGGEETKIRIFDLAAGSQVNELKDHTAEVNRIEWNSSSTKVATCCNDGTVRVFSLNKTSSSSSTNIPTASTSTASSSSSSVNSSANKLMISHETGCKRVLKAFFNVDDTLSCIGSS